MSTFWLQINFLIGIYLLGSIPVGLILSKIYKTKNPRTTGSKSIGTTNMLRIAGKKVAALTLALDCGKGVLAIVLAHTFMPHLYQLAGLVVVFGHIFPIWLGFRGGKGIGPALGVLLAWDWQLALACLATWGALTATTGYVSLGSLAAAFIAPVAAYVLQEQTFVLACLILTFLVLLSHRQNILRLIQGKEPKLGATKTDGNTKNSH